MPSSDEHVFFGFGGQGSLRLWRSLFVAGAASWSEGGTGAPAQTVAWPSLRGHLALRYRLPVRRAYIELRAQGSTGRLPLSTSPITVTGRGPFVRAGLAGGLELGGGVRLDVTVDNGLDVDTRWLDDQGLRSGLDLRARLSWSPWTAATSD